MFALGMKVVCIKAHTPLPYEPPPYAVLNAVYTISEMHIGSENRLMLQFEEMRFEAQPIACFHADGTFVLGFWEAGFYADNFRPLVSKKTDISVFKEMLTDAPVPVPA